MAHESNVHAFETAALSLRSNAGCYICIRRQQRRAAYIVHSQYLKLHSSSCSMVSSDDVPSAADVTMVTCPDVTQELDIPGFVAQLRN
jgi:hypothetical protein